MTVNDILNEKNIYPNLLLAVYKYMDEKILYIGNDRKMPEEIAEREAESFSVEKLVNVNDNSKIVRMKFYVFW